VRFCVSGSLHACADVVVCQVLHVGDSQESDIDGAKQIGWRAVKIRHSALIVNELDKKSGSGSGQNKPDGKTCTDTKGRAGGVKVAVHKTHGLAGGGESKEAKHAEGGVKKGEGKLGENEEDVQAENAERTEIVASEVSKFAAKDVAPRTATNAKKRKEHVADHAVSSLEELLSIPSLAQLD
jgi:hypothetical protein